MADQAAREAAEKQSSPGEPGRAAKLLLPPDLPPIPDYTKEEELWAKNEGGITGEGGWWKLPDQRLFVPSAVATALLKQQHELTHFGKTALEKLPGRYHFVLKLPTLCAPTSARCGIWHGIMQIKDQTRPRDANNGLHAIRGPADRLHRGQAMPRILIPLGPSLHLLRVG